MTLRPTIRPFAVLLLALVVPAAASAQAEGDGFHAGLRLGAFEMVNSSDSYDAAFGEPMPMLGVQVEWQIRPRILLGASLDYGEVDGELVLLLDPASGSGVEQTLTYIPLHVTGAWRADRGGDWAILIGGGPSFLSWERDSDLGSADGSDFGGHLMASLRRLGERWTFGGDLRWSTFPGAGDGDSGATVNNFFDEDDFGGVSLHLVALRGF